MTKSAEFVLETLELDFSTELCLKLKLSRAAKNENRDVISNIQFDI